MTSFHSRYKKKKTSSVSIEERALLRIQLVTILKDFLFSNKCHTFIVVLILKVGTLRTL